MTLDDEVLRAVKVRAARTGKRDSEVIEGALRRELGLGLLDHIWERNDLYSTSTSSCPPRSPVM